jgi:hypothetical protein
MPELERLRSVLAEKGIDVVGVNMDTEPQADLKGFLERTQVSYPIYSAGAGGVERLYPGGELVVPISLLLDDRGRLLELIPDWSDESRRRFAALGSDLKSE